MKKEQADLFMKMFKDIGVSILDVELSDESSIEITGKSGSIYTVYARGYNCSYLEIKEVTIEEQKKVKQEKLKSFIETNGISLDEVKNFIKSQAANSLSNDDLSF